jgi:hypothetical protein
MNLRAKIYVVDQKKRTQEKLDVRLALLKEKGIKDEAIQKDATVRQLKAEVRKADYRLAAIASQEKLIQERAQAKTEKVAAQQAAKEKKETEVSEESPEKKKTKGKKEKQAKQAKPEGKKEKPEKKATKPESE